MIFYYWNQTFDFVYDDILVMVIDHTIFNLGVGDCNRYFDYLKVITDFTKKSLITLVNSTVLLNCNQDM